LTVPRAFRALIPLAAAAAALAACSSTSDRGASFATATYTPAPTTTATIKTALASTPRSTEGQRPRRGGGYYTVGQPYRIAGKTYVPREEPHYSKVGVASWYGYDFHGRKTANGEIYDLDAVTAAHPTLPLPSYARVTNLENGRSIVVRVNDRGPFVGDRIIDVSRTVARKLAFEHAGTVQVRVDYLGPASLDGEDEKMLLASYREPGTPPNPSGGPVVMVAATQPVAPAPQEPLAFTEVAAAATRAAPAAGGDAPVSVVMRTGIPEPDASRPTAEAAGVTGTHDLSTRLTLAAAKKASELRLDTTTGEPR
jgi:rare lipoprotein A